MKGKISFMWRATLALVLVLSLGVVMAAPVSAAVSEPEVTLNNYAPAAADAIYTIDFTTNEELASGDTITIEFPEDGGTVISAITDAVDADVKVEDTDQASVIVGQRLSITLGNALPIGDVTVVVGTTHAVTNPADGDYTLDVYTREEPTAVTSAEYTISTTVTGVTEEDDAPAPQTVGTAATYDIDFTTTEELRSSDIIVIEFPVDTDISNVDADDVTVTDKNAGDVALSLLSPPIPVGQVLTITLGGTLIVGATEVTVDNIINPTTVLNPDPESSDLWTLTVYTTFATGTGGDRISAVSDAYALTAKTAISQIAWSTVDEYVPNDTDADQVGSTEFVIETQDQYGNPVVVTENTTFTLTASSGDFYGEAACTGVITSIQIDSSKSDSGASTNTLFYKGDYNAATDGTVTITADETVSQAWDIASTTILVNPKLELWGGEERKAYYNTFTAAIAAALPDDTIKVAPSTYEEDFTVNKPYLTIESTDGKATTIIEGTISVTGAGANNFVLGGSSGKGFTLQEGPDFLIALTGPTDVTISYNTLDTTRIPGSGNVDAIRVWNGAISGLTVTENTFIIADTFDMGVRGHLSSTVSELTVTDNVFTGADKTDEASAIEINSLDITTLDTLISGNTMTAMGFGVAIGYGTGEGGLITGDTGVGTLEISGNDFDAGVYGVTLINAAADADDEQNVVITQNTFTGNTYGIAIDYSLYIVADDYLEPDDFIVEYNDFSGNTYAIYNAKDIELKAENNYWGSATGPTITANVGGIGDRVSTEVDYDPWLNAAGGTPIKSHDITLVAGWNLISLPLIPVDPDIDTVLAGADVTVNKVAYYTGGPAGSWLNYSPSAPSDLDTMNDGKGYWVDASAGTLTATGFELALHGQAPPTYDVVAGWNLIGVTSITATPPKAEDYLGSVMDTVQAMYHYDAATGAYIAVITTTNLLSGSGYWLAVNAAGKIYP